jgi:hypothetical protein
MIEETVMTLTVELTPEEQDSLAIQATARGVSLEALVHSVLLEAVGIGTHDDVSQTAPALPSWRGTVIAPLSREDIYGDAG